jgi:hypothetical protein
MRSLLTYGIAVLLAAAFSPGLFAQSIQDGIPPGTVRAAEAREIPLRRAALFSSGVGYFEHAGPVSGSAEITLPFNVNAVNDALKSLVVNDPGSRSPSVHYPSERTLYRTLKSLKIDLSGNRGAAQILNDLKGAELEVYTPNLISGRIMGIEYRPVPSSPEAGQTAPWLSLYTAQGVRVINLSEIASFSFKDPRINADLNRALDLIMASRDSEIRNLTVYLPGEGSRAVSLSYVIPAPVWKVSYRLDLSQSAPFLQGWAIVDNDGDSDWDNVELSLVTGRPVSFIQNLYPPYHLARPVLPLAIAGIAQAQTHDSGWGGQDAAVQESKALYDEIPRKAAAERAAPAPNAAGGTMETARGQAAGDQFEFTIRGPVSLARQRSAMFPLVEGPVKAEKTLVFSGARAASGGSVNPAISAELTNTTGMKLPAGPVTVFDGGTYGGDALLEFFPPGERRIISYGEDLSVTGSVTSGSSRLVTSVTVSGGVMTIHRKQGYEKTYTFKNASGEPKRLMVEHPVTRGAELKEPVSYSERTDTLYRFVQTLPAGRELNFTVTEESPLSERIVLAQLRPDSFLSYSANQELPAGVRAALERAAELRRRVEAAGTAQTDLETRRTRLVSEQDRIRRNLEAAGNQTQQGQEYLRRMVAMDGDIDALNAGIETARNNLRAAQNEYDAYLGSINL